MFILKLSSLSYKKLFSDVVGQMLLKNIKMHILNSLNLIYIVVFDVETALDNAKLKSDCHLQKKIVLFASMKVL